jgi:formylglycine-generating enzyme required for sulfatase activity
MCSARVEHGAAGLKMMRHVLSATFIAFAALLHVRLSAQPLGGAQASAPSCALCPATVRIPAGEFVMGSPERDLDASQYERPSHRVRIKAFEIGTYAVTFAQWDACIRDGGCLHRPLDHGWGRGDRPVVDVSWEDAKQYVSWLNSKTTGGFRLPTEAEWEYAARAGRGTVRYWGDGIGVNRANCDGCGSRWDNRQTAPGGSFAANSFGLYDMLGNVWQWVEDCWHDSYAGAPRDGRAWTHAGNCAARVARGGSWNYTRRFTRAAGRDRFDATLRFYDLGFRVARDVPD